ncbi:MAG: hypothetical protein ABL959_03050 [Pyrinomonadaceae bacterium]
MAKVIFIITCVLAFLAPFAVNEKPRSSDKPASNNFPAEFEGRELRDLGLSESEQFFLLDFPGQIGRFSDGNREIIIRRVTEPTRKLHPASDCLEAVGYSTSPLPVRIDVNNKHWACFLATKQDDRVRVCERIYDENGNEWTDVSAWYWANWGSTGEWWAITVAERES